MKTPVIFIIGMSISIITGFGVWLLPGTRPFSFLCLFLGLSTGERSPRLLVWWRRDDRHLRAPVTSPEPSPQPVTSTTLTYVWSRDDAEVIGTKNNETTDRDGDRDENLFRKSFFFFSPSPPFPILSSLLSFPSSSFFVSPFSSLSTSRGRRGTGVLHPVPWQGVESDSPQRYLCLTTGEVLIMRVRRQKNLRKFYVCDNKLVLL